MNKLEEALQKLWGEELYRVIRQVRIGLAGAGGLGSNCAVHLVRSGFRHLRVVDDDRVEISNLNRQFYFWSQVGREKVYALRENLLRINPDVKVEAVAARIVPENYWPLFSGCHILVEALDDPREKAMLARLFFAHRRKTSRPYLLVAASGLAGWGRSDEIRCRRVSGDFYLVGDESREVTASHPPLAPRVNIAAAKQADLILEYVCSNRRLWEEEGLNGG